MADLLLGDSQERSTNPRIMFWEKELHNAMKRERKFRKEATRITKIYEAEKKAENSFNVLFSNTETLLPACYNQLPRPFVDRRFKDADPLGKFGAQALERVLGVLEDSGDYEYEPFSDLMELAVLGALVPGRGVTWFKYDAVFEKAKEVPLPEGADKTAEDAKRDVTGEDVVPAAGENVKYETICGEDVDYDEFLMGPGRTWSQIPWIARFRSMTEADAVESFGKEMAGRLTYGKAGGHSSSEWKKSDDEEDGDNPQGSQNVAPVWEIWNRERREVLFYSPSYRDDFLKEEEDPYGLSGFFPCPKPLQFIFKRSKLVPTAPYVLYEEQAKELNRITTRINKILGALKIRGFYDGSIAGLKGLLEAEDNTLIPAENVAALQEGKNLQNSIWLMPFEALVAALQSLWQGREEIKDTIYEITGMADIMRGEGAASAPATLQTIKNQWGTLRLKRSQRYVQEYVRGCMRIMGELAGKHFSIETFAQMTDLPFALPKEIQQAQETLSQVQAMMSRVQQMAPPPGVPGSPVPGEPAVATPPGAPAGGPPSPPQLPPQVMLAAQQAQATLQKPAWKDVVAFLRNDLQRYYRIDIETNSTISTDTDEDRQNINEAMTAIGQMMAGFMPMVEQGVMTMGAVKSMLLTIARRFAFGREVEDSIAQMPDQVPPQQGQQGPSPAEQQAVAAKAQADQAAAQAKVQQIQLDGKVAEQKAQFDQAEMRRKEEMAQQEHRLRMMEMAMKMQELQMNMAVSRSDAQADMQANSMQVADAARESELNAAMGRQRFEQGAAAGQQAQMMGAQKLSQAKQQAAQRKKPNGGAR